MIRVPPPPSLGKKETSRKKLERNNRTNRKRVPHFGNKNNNRRDSIEALCIDRDSDIYIGQVSVRVRGIHQPLKGWGGLGTAPFKSLADHSTMC